MIIYVYSSYVYEFHVYVLVYKVTHTSLRGLITSLRPLLLFTFIQFIKMPYQIFQEDTFVRLGSASFFPLIAVRRLVRTLAGTDYSVVASRREGHEALAQFIEDGLEGWSLFDENTRFAMESLRDAYLTDSDAVTNGILIALASSLSWRSSNVAKDTKEGTGSGSREANVVLAIDQGTQDNTKRFEELVKALGKLGGDSSLVWRRTSFESRVARWVEAPAAR